MDGGKGLGGQQGKVRGYSRVGVQGEVVIQFDYSGMVHLLVYPVLPACVPVTRAIQRKPTGITRT